MSKLLFDFPDHSGSFETKKEKRNSQPNDKPITEWFHINLKQILLQLNFCNMVEQQINYKTVI